MTGVQTCALPIWAHRQQVQERPCAHCRNRVNTGERAFGVQLLECGQGWMLPKRGICKGFQLDEGEASAG